MVRLIRSKTVVAGAIIAIVAALAAGVAAQGGGHRRGGRFGPGGFPGLAALDLTEAQREQVREVMQGHRDQMREAGTQLREAHAAQRAAVETVPVNEGLVRSTSQSLAAAQTEMAVLQARVHSAIWSVLTPEQQQKAKELKTKREARMKERRERRQQ
jgi:Spy/CpxP family protein refolding chaperone